MLDFSRSRLTPFQHQREDVQRVLDEPYFFITSEMRTGKSKIIIDAAQFMYEQGVIDRVVVVAPAPVRDVWFDPSLGEFAKHLWLSTPARVSEFHSKVRQWNSGPTSPTQLRIVVTNYEFIRAEARLQALMKVCNGRTLLVLDESAFVKSWKSAQTKSCMKLRKQCGRVVLLNGTPIFHSPMDLFSQGNILHPKILACPYVTHYLAKYALRQPILGRGGKQIKTPHGKPIEEITGWTNLEDLQQRFAPYTVRRLQKDCLDLPPKLESVALTATLKPATWQAYKEMRDEMVVWLQDSQVAVSATAAAKVLRLSQITSGFLGGVESESGSESSTLELGREKLDVLMWFLEQRFAEDPNAKVVAWCRFRAEMFRALETVRAAYPEVTVAGIYGNQPREERLQALALLKPETTPAGPVFCIGIEGTGSFGLDMTASHTCITLSSGYSPGRTAQTLDRVYGPGQRSPIAYYSILAKGPGGQNTIDHIIEKARRAGENVATWTASAWVAALKDKTNT